MRNYSLYIDSETVLNTFVNLPDRFRDYLSQEEIGQVLQHQENYYEMQEEDLRGGVSFKSLCSYIREALRDEGLWLSVAAIKAILEAEEEYYKEISFDY